MEDGASNRSPALPVKIRRFKRLTNAFSKKLDNHRWTVALHCMHYNFYRVHEILRFTPAMEVGTLDHVWLLEETVSPLNTSDNIAAETANARFVVGRRGHFPVLENWRRSVPQCKAAVLS